MSERKELVMLISAMLQQANIRELNLVCHFLHGLIYGKERVS